MPWPCTVAKVVQSLGSSLWAYGQVLQCTHPLKPHGHQLDIGRSWPAMVAMLAMVAMVAMVATVAMVAMVAPTQVAQLFQTLVPHFVVKSTLVRTLVWWNMQLCRSHQLGCVSKQDFCPIYPHIGFGPFQSISGSLNKKKENTSCSIWHIVLHLQALFYGRF